jgi:hypothetical protein
VLRNILELNGFDDTRAMLGDSLAGVGRRFKVEAAEMDCSVEFRFLRSLIRT